MARESILIEVGQVESDGREIGARSPNVVFRPLNKAIRGTFDFRTAGPMAARESMRWPAGPIPGQQIELDPETATGAIVDPLHDPQHVKFKLHIEKSGMRLPPAREEFRSVDVCEWTWWIRRLIDSGLARLVRGKLPEASKLERPKSASLKSPESENQDLRTQIAQLQGQLNMLMATVSK